jgi:uncharacterized protein (DUF1778 family)
MITDVLERRGAALEGDRQPHDTTVNVRMSSNVRTLIDRAAAIMGKSRSEFITESARLHAVDVLLDQRLFIIDSEQYDALQKALDDPPKPNDELKALMRRKPIWGT